MLGSLIRAILPVSKQLPVYVPATHKRAFAGASAGRLWSDWFTSEIKTNDDIRANIKRLRARSRQLVKDNDYAKRFISLFVSNVIGPYGIKLQNKAKDTNGALDTYANQLIEENWKAWGKKGVCTVCGRYSWRDFQSQVAKHERMDGEVFVRKVRGFPNEFGFALQLITADKIDSDLNEKLSNGHEIIMGIEIDEWGRPVAYYMKNDDFSGHTALPADEIEHIYIPLFDGAVRGVPAFHTAMTRLYMLGQYEEAELVGARIAAAKMGFFTRNAEGEYVAEEDNEGDFVSEVAPGVFEVLPAGVDFKAFDPQHPTTAFKDFVKAILRGIAAGLDVSYFTLANDLSDTNYSSARVGLLEDRSLYRSFQQFFIEHLCQPVFEAWLEMVLLTGKINLPFSKFDKFNAPKWQPRGWDWVDPLKDVKANIEAINARLKSRTQVVAEGGYDFEEIVEDIEKENELLGVSSE